MQKKSNMATFVKFAFYCLEGLVSYLGEYQTLFLGLICPRSKQEEFSIFLTKIMGLPVWEKYCNCVKQIFL